MERGQYDQAIVDIFVNSEKLAQLKIRDPQQYDLSLRAWQIQSRADLLAARIMQTSQRDPKVEEALRQLYTQQVKLEIELQKLQRSRLEAQLKRIQASLEKLESPQRESELVETRMRKIIRKATPRVVVKGKEESSGQ
jgi:hypothetical protein